MFQTTNHDHPANEPTPQLFDLYHEVLVEAKGKNLTERDPKCVQRVNAFLREFRRMVEGTKIKENGFFARIDGEVDDHIYELVSDQLLLWSFKVRWTITSSIRTANNAQHNTNAKLCKALKEIKLEEGKYNMKLSARIVDFKFAGDARRGRWPKDNIEVIGF